MQEACLTKWKFPPLRVGPEPTLGGSDRRCRQQTVGLGFLAGSSWVQLDSLPSGAAMFPAPGSTGEWTDRPVTTTEVKKWLHMILGEMVGFDPKNLTAHGFKSTTLGMMARFGLSPFTRLVLGPLNAWTLFFGNLFQRCPSCTFERVWRNDGSHKKGGLCSGCYEVWAHGRKPILRSASTVTSYLIGNFHPKQSGEAEMGEERDGFAAEDLEKEGGCGDNIELLNRLNLLPHRRALQRMMNLSAISARAQNRMKFGRRVARSSSTRGREVFLCRGKLCLELKGALYAKEWLCMQCDRGKPLRSVEGMADAFDRAVKRIRPTWSIDSIISMKKKLHSVFLCACLVLEFFDILQERPQLKFWLGPMSHSCRKFNWTWCVGHVQWKIIYFSRAGPMIEISQCLVGRCICDLTLRDRLVASGWTYASCRIKHMRELSMEISKDNNQMPALELQVSMYLNNLIPEENHVEKSMGPRSFSWENITCWISIFL